jgi:Na+-driven multidrug efflux pump
MNLAIIIGFINMLSFIILYYLIGGQINELLTKVMKIDVVASVVLLVCYLMNQYFKGNQ